MTDFSDNMDDLGLTPDEKSLEPTHKIDKIDSLSREDAFVSLKKKLLGSSKKNERLAAAWQLGKSGDSRSVKILLEASKSESDTDVNSEIISALGWLRDKQAVPYLVEVLTKDKDDHLRRKAAWALSNLSDSQTAIDQLGKTLSGDKDEEVREEAAWALGEIDDPCGESYLIDSVLADSSAKVRKMSVWALAQINGEKSEKYLIEALEGDMNEEVRREAAWVIGREKLVDCSEKLAKMLRREEHPDTLKIIIWALAQIGTEDEIGFFDHLFEENYDDKIKEEAAWALAQIGNKKGARLLEKHISGQTDEAVKVMVWALGQIADKDSIKKLEELKRKSESEEVIDEIVWVINLIKE